MDWNPLHDYCEAHTTLPHPVLAELERVTFLQTLAPQMMSGRLQGQLMAMLSKMIRPQRILEIGTFTGYGTICLAQGLAPGGTIDTIEVKEEYFYITRPFFERAGIDDHTTLHHGRAEEVVPTLSGAFDMIYMDAGKKDYPTHYALVIDRLSPGGLLLVDNLLWDNKVVSNATDKMTQHLRAFNDQLHADPRTENVLLPIRDGLTILRRLP